MSKGKNLIAATLLGALISVPAFAADNKDNNDDYQRLYREHYMQRHQMNMDMMKMLSETMTILRNLEHRPTEADKKKLDEMISQLNDMIKQHQDMDKRYLDRMDRMNRIGPHHMGPGGMGGMWDN